MERKAGWLQVKRAFGLDSRRGRRGGRERGRDRVMECINQGASAMRKRSLFVAFAYAAAEPGDGIFGVSGVKVLFIPQRRVVLCCCCCCCCPSLAACSLAGRTATQVLSVQRAANVLYCTVLHCTVPHRTAPHRTAPYRSAHQSVCRHPRATRTIAGRDELYEVRSPARAEGFAPPRGRPDEPGQAPP